MIVETYRKHRLGFASPLGDESRDQFIDHLRKPASASTDPLRGRAQVDFLHLPEWGNLVVKHYMRGGLMRHFSQRHHFRGRASRGELEFRTLQSLHAAGLPVPQPLGWAESGRLLVQTWLFLTEIPRANTLAQIAQDDTAQAVSLLPEVGRLIDLLVDQEIHHVDLHPGNILVDEQQKLYLIDFDKAAHVANEGSELRDRHYRRWNRAIAKHQLPSNLNLSQSPATT